MLCGIFSALIAVGAFLRVPVPLVPFTLQLFFVTMAGFVLGPRLGAVSALVYVALGLLGRADLHRRRRSGLCVQADLWLI